MRILEWIKEYFKKFCSLFRKNKPGKILRDRIEKAKETRQKAIGDRIKKRIQQKEPISAGEISVLAEVQTAEELSEELGALGKKQTRFFDLVGIEQEVRALNERLIGIQIKQAQIGPILIPRKNSTDKDIEELERFLQKHDNKRGLVLSAASREKLKSRFDQFDRFFQERMLVKIYHIREEDRKREQDVKKQQLKELISRIENLINQGKFQEAKSQISKAYDGVSGLRDADLNKSFRAKLETLKIKLREGRTREEEKRQEKELKKQQEEEEHRKREEEKKREEDRQRKAREEQNRKQQEIAEKKKEKERQRQLQSLLKKKPNWQEFQEVLRANEVTVLYHFTDRANISSIKKNQGLYSWYFCDNNSIQILKPGGSPQSRQNDTTNGKKDFVRLAFNKEHPMLYIAQKEHRVTDPIWLEVDTEVVLWESTEFADKNAAAFRSYCPNIGKDLQYLKNIRFDILKKAKIFKHYNLAEEEKPFNQAEVLVKTWIPIKYITNINEF